MIAREVRWLMRHKVKEGVPIALVAWELGVARQTVYNFLQRGEVKPRPKRGSKLDLFKDHVRARLEPFGIPATVLYRELREQGYAGSLTTLKVFVREVKGAGEAADRAVRTVLGFVEVLLSRGLLWQVQVLIVMRFIAPDSARPAHDALSPLLTYL